MRQLNPITLALLVGGIVLLLVVAVFATGRNADQDKLTGNELSGLPQRSADERCASERTYDTIKRELFRRAARLRGSDQSAFDSLAAYSVVRMTNPVVAGEDEETGSVECRGWLSLDLPPGVAVVGGRRSLSADIVYTVQRAADGSGDVVMLSNADAIINPLATLARIGQPQGQPLAPASNGGAATPSQPHDSRSPSNSAPTPAPPPARSRPEQQREPPQPRPEQTSAKPSFNCANARTRGELAVCRDPGLAALDRQMAAQFYRERSRATPEQRAALERTRDRFLRQRDSCRSDSCIADTYRARMREISAIMSD